MRIRCRTKIGWAHFVPMLMLCGVACGRTNMASLVVGLGDYRVDLKKLAGLGPRKVSYSFALKGLDPAGLVPLAPRERNRAVSDHLRRSLASIKRRLPFDYLQPRDRKKPWTVDAVSDIGTFVLLSHSRFVAYLFVKRISSLRKYRKARRGLSFFAVRARVAIQVEDQTSELQATRSLSAL